ncbi:MlaD family protein [Nannocystis sp. SCPEA4]|uniref:MlaD family protein n=1 Tax=Nannocystis sp. SCPEA4 TaxID=2996787 RepID=UPI00227023B8|nr:MlaD family protein [Nannocystis sp. SCPEA4]MCY1062730.1 MlaD family protein [Nannocystis sp. SCPEA4]
MARIRTQAVKLGIFVVSVVTILVLALVLVGGLRLGRPADTYHIITSGGVLGLDLESSVTMRGVKIGRVAAIELDRSDFGRVRIDLKIDPSIALPAPSRAYFQRVGVTGQRGIDITGGTLADGRLAPGSTIPRGETPLEILEARASGLGEELTTLVADATQTVRGAKAVIAAIDPERVAAIVEAVDPKRVAALLVHGERTARTLASTSRQLQRALNEGRAHLGDLARDVDAFAARASTVLEHADGASLELSRLLVGATTILNANEDDLRAAIGNIRRVSQDARALVRALRTRPSLLLRSAPPKDRALP